MKSSVFQKVAVEYPRGANTATSDLFVLQWNQYGASTLAFSHTKNDYSLLLHSLHVHIQIPFFFQFLLLVQCPPPLLFTDDPVRQGLNWWTIDRQCQLFLCQCRLCWSREGETRARRGHHSQGPSLNGGWKFYVAWISAQIDWRDIITSLV